MRNIYADGARGFTLIELLTSMAIISILVALALPQYSAYRKKAFDLRALSDLRNVATAEEAYFLDNEKYQSCKNALCAALPGIKALSQGVTLQISANESSFTGSALHPKGSGKTFLWDNDKGGLLP